MCREAKAAGAYGVLHKVKQQEAAAELNRQAEAERAQVLAARNGRALVRRLMREAHAKMQERLAEVQEGVEGEWQIRAQAVAELKQTVRNVHSDMAARVTLYRYART